jgi:preprotein translocase subunit SecY
MVLIITGVRKIPIQFAKRMVGRGANNMPVAGARDYIPLKVNAAGCNAYHLRASADVPARNRTPISRRRFRLGSGVVRALNDYTSGPYNILYFTLVVVFTYVYTALMVNPQQYAEYLKRQTRLFRVSNQAKRTSDYIDAVTTRITLRGFYYPGAYRGLCLLLPAPSVSTLRLLPSSAALRC